MALNRIALAALAAVAAASAAQAAGGSDWRLAGKTYNSVAFVDLASVRGSGQAKSFTALRISGQPAKDGWRNVVQKLTVNCGTRIFTDGGSRIEQADGSVKAYPGIGAKQIAQGRGIFFDMYTIVCQGRAAPHVADPKAWTRANFTVG